MRLVASWCLSPPRTWWPGRLLVIWRLPQWSRLGMLISSFYWLLFWNEWWMYRWDFGFVCNYGIDCWLQSNILTRNNIVKWESNILDANCEFIYLYFTSFFVRLFVRTSTDVGPSYVTTSDIFWVRFSYSSDCRLVVTELYPIATTTTTTTIKRQYPNNLERLTFVSHQYI